MALSPPAFKKNAIPSTRGWHDPKTGELLTARPMSQADVDEYNGVVIHPEEDYEPVAEDVENEIQFLTEADPTPDTL